MASYDEANATTSTAQYTGACLVMKRIQNPRFFQVYLGSYDVASNICPAQP